MKALTLHQPYASLVALGVKTIETRSWPAPKGLVGQHIAIHASKTRDHSKTMELDDLWHELGFCFVDDDRFPLGAIVATARLVDCVPIIALSDYPPDGPGWLSAYDNVLRGVNRNGTLRAEDDQLPYGDFRPGRWAWLLDDIKATTERCPACMGRGGYLTNDDPMADCGWCSTRGTCPPIPAKGRQGVWNWTP